MHFSFHPRPGRRPPPRPPLQPKAPLPPPPSRRYALPMEISLRLRKAADGRLIYGIPLWYRAMTAAILLLVAGAMLSSEGSPGLIAWLIFALLALGLVYEERWTLDPASKTITHRWGFWPLAKASSNDFASIEEFLLKALARGTVPGTKEESLANERAFAMMNHKDADTSMKKSFLKSASRVPYMNLLMKTTDGEIYLVDSIPARRAAKLTLVGQAFADASGREFVRNPPQE